MKNLEVTYKKDDHRNVQRTSEILNKIRFIAMSAPQFRVGQIICNVLEPGEDLKFIHDGELLNRLNKYIKVHFKRNPPTSKPAKLSITPPAVDLNDESEQEKGEEKE